MWNEEAFIASKEIILCEALIDALTFWCAGFRNVTASYGMNGFTDRPQRGLREARHRARVHRLRPRRGGRQAAAKLAEELIEMGIECYRVRVPKGMDANDYALKVTPATKSLGVLLNRCIVAGQRQRRASQSHCQLR